MYLTTRWIRRITLSILIMFLALIPLSNVLANSVSVNVSTLNVRSGPGLTYEIMDKINQGQAYPILSEKNEWIEIDLGNGKSGWVANWLVEVSKEEEQVSSIESKIDKLNVRSGPSTSFSVVDQIAPGETYPIVEKNGDWIQIQLSETKKGWVANWLVETKSITRKETTSYNKNQATVNVEILNVRSGPGTSYERIAQLDKGTLIEILEVKNGWYKLQLNGKNGWVAGQFAQQTNKSSSSVSNIPAQKQNTVQVQVKANVLNFRSEPTLEAEVIDQLEQGTQATLLKRDGEWANIQLVNGKSGWVADWLITEISGGAIVNQPTIKILNEGTNLRSGPSTKDPVVTKANEGDIFPVINTIGDWYQIQLNNGSQAYVAGWVVAADGLPNITNNSLQNSLKGKVIVVDPGHGGKDQGAEGVSKKTKEKDINLKVAKILAEKLKSAGAKVIMTREKDTFVSLENRVYIASRAKADAFISVHHNTYEKSSMNGTITFYYGKTDKKLAQMIQTELIKRNGLKDLGERFGDFYVLRENPRLSVLVELGFLSNSNEELVLRSSKFQENAAEGIFQGILKYFK